MHTITAGQRAPEHVGGRGSACVASRRGTRSAISFHKPLRKCHTRLLLDAGPQLLQLLRVGAEVLRKGARTDQATSAQLQAAQPRYLAYACRDGTVPRSFRAAASTACGERCSTPGGGSVVGIHADGGVDDGCRDCSAAGAAQVGLG